MAVGDTFEDDGMDCIVIWDGSKASPSLLGDYSRMPPPVVVESGISTKAIDAKRAKRGRRSDE